MKEIMQKEREAWMDINVHYISVILKKADDFQIMTNRPDKGRFFSQNQFVCNVTIILLVKEFRITIFQF